MLLPDQVLPKLLHADRYVRELAARYLGGAHDPGPATAEDVWKAVDQAGNGDWTAAFEAAVQKLPQTEGSLRRTLAAIERKPGEARLHALVSVIANLPYGLLMRFRDLIDAPPALPADLREHLQQRYALAELGPGELWDKLMAHADQAEQVEGFPDPQISERLIEALARNPEPTAWAIPELDQSKPISFRTVFAVDLLGKMRHRPSAPLLYNELVRAGAEDADVLLESATTALVRVGNPQVVQLVLDGYAVHPECKLYAIDILGRTKLPKSETALLQLLERESDREMKTFIASGLCDLAATEPRALEKLREMIAGENWDRTAEPLDEDVVALFTMVGHHTPELTSWRAAIDDEGKRRYLTKKAFERKSPEMSKLVEMIGRQAEMESAPIGAHDEEPASWEVDDDELASIAPAGKSAPPPDAAPATIRRNTPKVGRNDPCPCGSGKKYKKCCGK